MQNILNSFQRVNDWQIYQIENILVMQSFVTEFIFLQLTLKINISGWRYLLKSDKIYQVEQKNIVSS